MSNKMLLINGYVVFENQIPEMQDRVIAGLEAVAAKTLARAEHYENLYCSSWDPTWGTIYMNLFDQWCEQRRELNEIAYMDCEEFARWYDVELKRIDARNEAKSHA